MIAYIHLTYLTAIYPSFVRYPPLTRFFRCSWTIGVFLPIAFPISSIVGGSHFFGRRPLPTWGYFSVWFDDMDSLCISFISAHLFTRHLYTQIGMASRCLNELEITRTSPIDGFFAMVVSSSPWPQYGNKSLMRLSCSTLRSGKPTEPSHKSFKYQRLTSN